MMEFIWENWAPWWDAVFVLTIGVVGTWLTLKFSRKN